MSGARGVGVGPGVSHPRTPVEYFWQDDVAIERLCAVGECEGGAA